MKKVIILAFLLSLTGCKTLTNTSVEFKINCEQLLGKVGNSCSIEVPDSSYVHIDGETINVEYAPNRI